MPRISERNHNISTASVQAAEVPPPGGSDVCDGQTYKSIYRRRKIFGNRVVGATVYRPIAFQ
jgi:hypothetical protein